MGSPRFYYSGSWCSHAVPLPTFVPKVKQHARPFLLLSGLHGLPQLSLFESSSAAFGTLQFFWVIGNTLVSLTGFAFWFAIIFVRSSVASASVHISG